MWREENSKKKEQARKGGGVVGSDPDAEIVFIRE